MPTTVITHVRQWDNTNHRHQTILWVSTMLTGNLWNLDSNLKCTHFIFWYRPSSNSMWFCFSNKYFTACIVLCYVALVVVHSKTTKHMFSSCALHCNDNEFDNYLWSKQNHSDITITHKLWTHTVPVSQEEVVSENHIQGNWQHLQEIWSTWKHPSKIFFILLHQILVR